MYKSNPPKVVTQGEGLLPVIQADREAATSLAEWLSAAQKEWEGMVVWFDEHTPREFRRGHHDDHEFVQAFARHRLRHTPDMAAFGASDVACYHYPGEDEQALRAAFCHGAEQAIRNTRHTPDREAIARVLRGYMRDGLEPEPFGGSLDTADLAADAIIAMFEGGGAHG